MPGGRACSRRSARGEPQGALRGELQGAVRVELSCEMRVEPPGLAHLHLRLNVRQRLYPHLRTRASVCMCASTSARTRP